MLRSHAKENARHSITAAKKIMKEGSKGINQAFSGEFAINYKLVMEGLDMLAELGRKEWSHGKIEKDPPDIKHIINHIMDMGSEAAQKGGESLFEK